MRSFQILSIALAFGAFANVATADTLDMRGSNRPSFSHSDQPPRGMAKRKVESVYGAPSMRRSPVGNPPITRWEYAGFIVYFEYDRVIHSVSKRS